ncbi:MAG TPA: twin-arginine translocase TatA/TatE family subunit, partial [Opitutus sp.]|nr:twin-arginine translocase TatA/TatE family subunit [Opitutus sp.]
MTPELFFFAILPDLGGGEMMLILLVMLLLFGGDKMPQMAKSLAKTLREFKRAASEVER